MSKVCGLGNQSSGHFFRECETACDVWLQSRITFETQGVWYHEFLDLV